MSVYPHSCWRGGRVKATLRTTGAGDASRHLSQREGAECGGACLRRRSHVGDGDGALQAQSAVFCRPRPRRQRRLSLSVFASACIHHRIGGVCVCVCVCVCEGEDHFLVEGALGPKYVIGPAIKKEGELLSKKDK